MSVKKGNKKKKKKYRFNLNSKLVFVISLFIIFFVTSVILFVFSFSLVSEPTISLIDKSNINYRVYLKENDFYDEEYLDENMVYVSSLIDKIQVDFNYNFNISQNSRVNFLYDVIGELVITDASGSKMFYERKYNLLDEKEISLINKDFFELKEKVDVDYIYYNDLANRYRQQYGVNSKSSFNVYLNLYKTSSDKSLGLNQKDSISIQIPLTENEVNIKVDSNGLNKQSNIIRSSKYKVTNVIYLVLSMITMSISFYLLFKLLKLMRVLIPKRSKYDKTLKKILKEYDRFIVETSTEPNISNYKVIKVDKFVELLDVRDNLRQPIKYYNDLEVKKSIFYVTYDNDVYIYTLKDNG